jgi:glutathione S-transferase
VQADQIERISAMTSRRNTTVLRNDRPQTGLEAKFSMQFAMASSVVAGRAGLTELTDAFVQREDVQSLIRKVEVIADGICDACVLLFWERHRPAAQQSTEWIARQRRKVDGGLRELTHLAGEREWVVGDRFGLADICVGTVLRYLDVRFPEHPWRSQYANLVTLSARMEARPSFAATVPVAQRISDKVV